MADRADEIMAALIAEFGEPETWDEETAMRFARYAYGQGYTDAQLARPEGAA